MKDIAYAALPALLLVVLTVGPLGVFAWLFMATDTFTIQAVTIVDAREHTELQVRDIVDGELSRHRFSRNVFFAPLEVIKASIQERLPQVRTVHTTRLLPGTLKVIIQEKDPSLLLLSDGAYYFVDDQGTPYERASLDRLPGIVLPVVKNQSSDNAVTIGIPAVDESFVQLVHEVQERLPDTLDAHVVEMKMPSLSAREVHVLLNTNWSIKFDTQRAVEAQFHALQRVVDEVVTADELQALEYIDLRIPNRVYYRVRGQS